MKLNAFIYRFLFSTIILLCLVVCVAMAQPGDPGGDPDVPISGIEVLLGIGGVLGIRRLLSNRKDHR